MFYRSAGNNLDDRLRRTTDRLAFLTPASLVTVAPQGDICAGPSHR